MIGQHGHGQKIVPSKRIWIVLIITAGYLVAEVVGGVMSNSLALLADAGHMLTDVAALAISLFAFRLSLRPPNKKASFGYYRAEVLAALFNGVTLLVVAVFLIKESVFRLINPSPVHSGAVMLIALGGLLVNLLGLKLLYKDKAASINIKSAWLHLLFDALGSIAALVSGIFIYFYGWTLADPIASIAIALMVLYSSVYLIAQTVEVLMENTPAHIDAIAVAHAIAKVPQALSVHDLHIWSIRPGQETLSAHVIITKDADFDEIQKSIHDLLADRFGINHVTIQLERNCTHPDATCEQNLPSF
jgi:cobalt-zinc-cadmium efflux system protein